MTIEFDLTDVNPDKLGEGYNFTEPGSYLFEVLEMVESDPKYGSVYADFEVLSGTPKGQEGTVHREYFNKRSIIEFAVAIKLTTYDEVKKHIANGTAPSIDFEGLAIGRLLCGKVEAETYEGKTRNKCGFRLWAVDSPKAKGIPLDRKKLAEFETLLADAQEPFSGPATDAGPVADGPSPEAAGPDEDLF